MTIPWLPSGHQVCDCSNTEPSDEHSVYSPFGLVHSLTQEPYLNENVTDDQDDTVADSRFLFDCFYQLRTVILFKYLSGNSVVSEEKRVLLSKDKTEFKRSSIHCKIPPKRKIGLFWKLFYISFALLSYTDGGIQLSADLSGIKNTIFFRNRSMQLQRTDSKRLHMVFNGKQLSFHNIILYLILREDIDLQSVFEIFRFKLLYKPKNVLI